MSCNPLEDYLVHTITIVPPELKGDDVVYDEFGEPIKGKNLYRQIKCFIDRKTRRHLDSNNRIAIYSATITFLGDAPIEVDWQVKDGVTNFGVPILTKGRIAYVDYVQSPESGILAKMASIEEL